MSSGNAGLYTIRGIGLEAQSCSNNVLADVLDGKLQNNIDLSYLFKKAKLIMKIVSIVGARPQIIKAAAISREIRLNFKGKITEIILHTGQHYDQNMSGVFFTEMNIPRPDYNLSIGSGPHGIQTAEMIRKIEKILLSETPNYIVLYGDTNSTLAGAIAASKIKIPIIHIEAGLRSFNKAMPEEINRIMCDHVSTLLFSPTKTGINNLRKEGFNINQTPPFSINHPGVFHCGDIMYDNSLFYSDIAEQRSSILSELKLNKGNYILGTIHRDYNTDDEKRLNSILSAIYYIAENFNEKIILPLHPRTTKLIDLKLSSELKIKISSSSYIQIIPPVSFLEMIQLEKNARMIMTDSGGVQKEAYFFQKPVIILRSETEWLEIVKNGAGIITDASQSNIVKAFKYFNNKNDIEFPAVFGDGKAANFICKVITDEMS